MAEPSIATTDTPPLLALLAERVLRLRKARGWSRKKALAITSICGLGHVASSVLLGVVGIGFGIAVGNLEAIESVRGDWAAWALMAFGVTLVAVALYVTGSLRR